MTSNISEYKIKMVKIHNYLGGKCVKCGSTEKLHIDHVDHTTKSFSIASNWGLSWSKLQPELDKCQLLCYNHHLEKSREEGSLAKGWSNQPRIIHGTVNTYSKHKCRCDACKKAKSESMKKQYLKNKNKS